MVITNRFEHFRICCRLYREPGKRTPFEKTLDGYKIIIPLEGLINPEEERTRLQKELTKLEEEIKIISSKLDNKQFIAKAPAEVIQKEKEKIEDAKNKKKMLEKSILNLEI